MHNGTEPLVDMKFGHETIHTLENVYAKFETNRTTGSGDRGRNFNRLLSKSMLSYQWVLILSVDAYLISGRLSSHRKMPIQCHYLLVLWISDSWAAAMTSASRYSLRL